MSVGYGCVASKRKVVPVIRLVRFLSTVLLAVLIASCGSVVEEAMYGLTAAQVREVAALRVAAADPDSIEAAGEGEWRVVAPGVTMQEVTRVDGSVAVFYRAEGLRALEWLADMHWRPRHSALVERINSETLGAEARSRLDAELDQLEQRLEVVKRWQEVAELDEGVMSLASCSPLARASAGPTTAAPGAKASASARTCTVGWTGYASAAAEQPYSHQQSWAVPGSLASASKVAYSSPRCSSAGYADGYPLFEDVWYHC